MADLADVENALKALVVGWCYPGGTAQPSVVPGAMPVKVGRGWPLKVALQADLAKAIANVSIYSQPGSERLTTRYPRDWQPTGAVTGSTGQAQRELRRQERLFQMTCWCATPEQRDALAGFLDARFAGAGDPNGLEFISLADGTRARLRYVRTAPTDKDELNGSFRRDLIYAVEYATTETATFDLIKSFETKVTATPSGTLLADIIKP